MNWQPIATLAAPLIAFFVGAFVNRKIEKRPNLVSFMSHSAAVPVEPPNGTPSYVNTHTVVIRNTGRAAANNVRLTHAILPPNFNVYPSIPYTVEKLQSGGADIVFPKLVPAEQVSVTYLYYPPLYVDQVNTNCKSDEGFAKIVGMLWYPQRSAWGQRTSNFLMGVGVLSLLSLIAWAVSSAMAS